MHDTRGMSDEMKVEHIKAVKVYEGEVVWPIRLSYAIVSWKSYNHILQFTVCLGHLYGCLVYFITAYLDGFNFWASPFYYWAYFIGANSSWVLILELEEDMCSISRRKGEKMILFPRRTGLLVIPLN